MKVQISQSQINIGVQFGCYSCPVALALLNLGCLKVRVTRTYATWIDGIKGTRMKAWLPWHATRFIDFFDRGRPVSEFFFVLEPMEEVA